MAHSTALKRAIVAKTLHNATIHLLGYRRDAAQAVAVDLLMEAERCVRSGFHGKHIDSSYVDRMLVIEHQYGNH